MLGWDDDGERPVIALEDLSDAHWPPPWTTEQVDAVLACLAEVAATPPPPDLPRAADSQFDFQGWIEIEDDPEPFLALGLCSSAWLDGRPAHPPVRHRDRPARRRRADALRRAERQPLHPRRPRGPDRLELRVRREPAGRCRVLVAEPPRRRGSGARRDPPGRRRRARGAPGRLLRVARRASRDPRGAARPHAPAPAGADRAPLGRAGARICRRPASCNGVAPATPC